MSRWHWVWVSPIYYVAVLKVLWMMCPISEDVGGPVATFFCANCPTPTAGEFHARYSEFMWVFVTPYLIAAFLLTLLGCGVAPRLARGWVRVAATSWGLIWLLAAITEAGTRADLWDAGSRIFVWDDWIIYMELKTTLAIAGVTAIFARLSEFRRSAPR